MQMPLRVPALLHLPADSQASPSYQKTEGETISLIQLAAAENITSRAINFSALAEAKFILWMFTSNKTKT